MFQTAGRVKTGQFRTVTIQAFALTGSMLVRALTLRKMKNWNKLLYVL